MWFWGSGRDKLHVVEIKLKNLLSKSLVYLFESLFCSSIG